MYNSLFKCNLPSEHNGQHYSMIIFINLFIYLFIFIKVGLIIQHPSIYREVVELANLEGRLIYWCLKELAEHSSLSKGGVKFKEK